MGFSVKFKLHAQGIFRLVCCLVKVYVDRILTTRTKNITTDFWTAVLVCQDIYQHERTNLDQSTSFSIHFEWQFLDWQNTWGNLKDDD